MNLRKLFLFALLVAVGACQEKEQTATLFPQAEQVDELMARYYQLGRFSGSVFIAQKDEVLYQSFIGFANKASEKAIDQQTVFKVGELSELFTAHLVEIQKKSGKLKGTEKVSNYLKGLKLAHTVDELLEHRVKLPSLAQVKEKHPDVPYGTLEYANLAAEMTETSDSHQLAYNVLGLLLEQVSGKSIDMQFVALDLTSTSYRNISVHLAKGYLFHNYRNQGLELVLAPEVNQEQAFSSLGIQSNATDLWKLLRHDPKKKVQLGGYLQEDGFSYYVHQLPEKEVTVIVLSNRRHPVGEEIGESILSIMSDEPYTLPLPREPHEVSSEVLKNYEGNYQMNEHVKFNVFQEHDSLFALLGPTKVHLIPQSTHQFYMKDRDAAMRFLTDENGKVTQVELLDGFVKGVMAQRIYEE